MKDKKLTRLVAKGLQDFISELSEEVDVIAVDVFVSLDTKNKAFISSSIINRESDSEDVDHHQDQLIDSMFEKSAEIKSAMTVKALMELVKKAPNEDVAEKKMHEFLSYIMGTDIKTH